MTVLSKVEREIVLTLWDAEAEWTVFTDSRRAISTRLLRVARALGLQPVRDGEGWTFTLPLKAIRVGVPRTASERQRTASKAALQKAKMRRNGTPRRRGSRVRGAKPDPEAIL